MKDLTVVNIHLSDDKSPQERQEIIHQRKLEIMSQLGSDYEGQVLILPDDCSIKTLSLENDDVIVFHIEIGKMSPVRAHEYIEGVRNSIDLPQKCMFIGGRKGEPCSDVIIEKPKDEK